MADVEEEDGVLPAYVEDSDEESAAAAAKQKRREESEKRKVPEWVEQEHEAKMAESALLAAQYYEYDHKTRSRFYTRACFGLLSTADLDEETQYGPMRFTDSFISNDLLRSGSLNVLSLKISSSDVGYPINVYGTVIARDPLDRKCITIFRRNRRNCQVIQSENEDLILTGPTRGIVFDGEFYLEVNLKIKESEEYDGREFSKGCLYMMSFPTDSNIVKQTLVSRLSEVDVVCSFVRNALEGTIEIKILSGPKIFHGKITACTTDVPNNMLLYDSDVDARVAGDDGVIQLLRRVVAVEADQMLILNFQSSDWNANVTNRSLQFTPQMGGADDDEIKFGLHKLRAKVIWSTLGWLLTKVV